ncbi:MAG: sialidase [Gemmatimonadota bacterium]
MVRRRTTRMKGISPLLLAVLLVPLRPGGIGAQSLASLPESFFADADFRYVGPVGNRVSAVVGVPGDPDVYYIGAASGGVFKSTDGGHGWTPVFDGQNALSIGALAVAPSDANVVWAGTGEAFIRSNVSIGNGVYRSTDAGKTWQHMGLEASGRIARIVIHPDDPDEVYVAALGHLYGPQEERGVYRTRDGGGTWERILFAGKNAGAVDLVMDPNNPRILFAATWEMRIWTWGRESGGPGSAIWKSTDGGDTWTRLEGHGLPRGRVGRIGLAMSPDDSRRVYALIETNVNREYAPLQEHEGVLWRSDDGGATWRMVNADHTLAQRPLYYSRMAVAPDDRDEVHFMSTRHAVSLDGGETFHLGSAGGDNHDMWIDPFIPDRMIVGHDQGISISTTRGESWYRPQLPIAQMYHVTTDTRVPYYLYGNRQDGGSAMGPSNTRSYGRIPIGAWRSVGGCESGWAVPDTTSNDVVWSGCYEGILERHEISTGITRTVSVWPDNPEGWPARDLRYRFQWTFPIHISPHDGKTVYVGSQHVHRTTDGGQHWEVISPDLTTNDRSKQRKTGGLTPDDVSPTYAAVLFAIAESPVEAGVIWAGSNDGLVHVTRNGGETWTDVTGNIPDLPPWGTVSNIEPSRFDAGTAYVMVDFHQLGDTDPYIYKTTDYGRSWRSLAGGIPRSVFSYVHVVREDPSRAGLLYVGTENAIYVSLDDGAHWTPLQGDLPHAPVHWLTVQPHFNDLVVSTYGRGFWILDDITPVQQLSDSILSAPVHFFEPRPAYRFLPREPSKSQPGDPAAGENPRYGAALNFYVREGGAPVKVVVEDASGNEVRTLSRGAARAGLNRIGWDLRYAPSREPRLRTPPLEHAHAGIGSEGWRAPPDGGRVRPLAVPGRYRIRLRVGDQERVRWLTVLQDPDSRAGPGDMQAQLRLQLELREMTDSVAGLIDRIEWTRKGVGEFLERAAEDDGFQDLVKAGEALNEALIDLEMGLVDLRLTGGSARQDTIRWPRQLYAKLTSLASYISGSDFGPTDQALEVRDRYRKLLDGYLTRWREIASGPLADLNARLSERGLLPVISQP